MDVFKKGTLKSQSLNSRFLASNSNNSSTPHRSLPVQSVKPLGVTQNTTFGSASKLKLTTSRQSSSLRATRENNLSPALNETGQSTSSNVAIEKKTPVWNKGMAPAKSAKNYTDDELKAMHGISLVSRNSNAAGTPKEGRWDDSDEDDDWGDTIDFGDGTKVTIGQSGTSDATMADSKLPDAIPAPTPRVVHSHPHLASPFADQAGGGPWKRAEPTLRSIPVESADFPTVNAAVTSKPTQQAQSPLNGIKHSALDPNNASQIARPAVHEIDHDRRVRSRSIVKDDPIAQSGDARYQYDQNTYDRHWQNPPQTREIFNSNTGRFEQIDATHKQGRRPSHNDKKTSEVLQRASVSSGDARLGAGHAAVFVQKPEEKSRAVQTQEAVSVGQMNGETKVESHTSVQAEKNAAPKEEIPLADVVVPLDPSSQEFIDMQKRLMADRREQAIQRRKDQEEEEHARKERARKKAEELAAMAEKEDSKTVSAESATTAKPAIVRPKIAVRPPQQDSARAERNILAQRATSAAIHEREQSAQSKVLETSEKAKESETWQRGVRIAKPSANTTGRGRYDEVSKFAHRDLFDLSAPTADDSPLDFENIAVTHGRDLKSPSQAAWGPIGSRKTSSAQRRDTSTFEADTQQETNNAPAQNPGQAKHTPAKRAGPSWSAFDGIARSIKTSANSTNETREYNVFDASDEIVAPEKVRQSPSTPGQTQSRTSSRFFPSVTTAVGDPKVQNSALPFVSPSLPPRTDTIQSAYYENPASVPTLKLPEIASSVSTIVDTGGDKKKRIAENKFAKYTSRVWLEFQTRSIWEIKPLKDGQSPRIRVPHAEKSLDWTRKGKTEATEATTAPKIAEKAPITVSTAIPAMPVWNMPLVLDTTTKDNHVRDPLVPLQPFLRLPSVTGEDNYDKPSKRKSTRPEEDRTSKYFTTRPSLVEEADNMSPIRVKTTAADVKVARKFGKRVDPSQNATRTKNDIKRQPVNMSDAPGGAGFKRGFANRTRSASTKAPVTAVDKQYLSDAAIGTAENGGKQSLLGSKAGQKEPGPVAILHRNTQVESDTGSSYNSVKPLQQTQRSPHSYNATSSQPKVFQPQQYTNLTQPSSVPAHLGQSPMLSRVAPPGLAAPVQATHKNEAHLMGAGPLSTSMPPTTSRGPPGIVLP